MNIEILGFGVMGQAIGKALAKQAKNKVRAFGRNTKKLRGVPGVRADMDLGGLPHADFVLISVKPQDLPTLAKETAGKIARSSILISIAAGVTIPKLVKLFKHQKVVRVMPSLTLNVGQGVALWKAATVLTLGEKRKVRKLLDSFTEHFEVRSEDLIDAGSVIYGCGPAYFFLLASHLQNAAVRLGISPTQSRELVQKTFLGAAILQRGQNYHKLIKKIASKKGMTEASLKVFQRAGLAKIVADAARAAYRRSKELGS